MQLWKPPTIPPASSPGLSLILLFVALLSGQLLAVEPPADREISGGRWNGEVGITETVMTIMAREASGLRQTGTSTRQSRLKRTRNEPLLSPQRPAARISNATARRSSLLRAAAVSTPAPNLLTVGTSFLGAQKSDSDFDPPDSMGDVGPTQFLVCINGRIRVFDKQGVLGSLDTTLEIFFTSVTSNGTTDPRVRYDRLTRRWIVTAIDVPPSNQNNKILIAVSNGSILSGNSSFTFYSFQHNLASPSGDTGRFADYPTLGVDRHALYIGVNLFDVNDNYVGATGYVINKSNLLTGTLTVTAFRGLAGTTGPGLYTPQGVDNDDPASTEGYFVGIDNETTGLLVLRRISNPGGTPTISGNINLTVPATSDSLGGVTAKGSNATLDDVDNRLLAARMHKGSLWTAHNLAVDANGAANPAGDRDGARWYEITNLSTTPNLRQSGTLFDPAANRAASYWIPTCAVSGQGHMALGCSVAGLDQYAGIAVAGRLAGDALGTLRAPLVAQTSSTPYLGFDRQRWGDYSIVTLDPNDGMTFWTVQEYCNAENSWGVRVIQLLAPPPAKPTACLPAIALIGTTNLEMVVTGTVQNGSGFFDPGPDYTNRISATFNDPAITVTSVTYTDPQHVTLSLRIAPGATNGSRTLSIINPDGQVMTSAPGIITLTEQPIIESITESGSSATITWQALAGKNYRVQYKNDLNASTWNNLSGDVTATSGLASKVDPFGSATERYYQVIILP
jgi:hypothetical protein